MKSFRYLGRFTAMKRLPTFLFATLLALSASGKLAAADPESAFGLAPTPPAQNPPPQSVPLIPDGLQPVEKPKDSTTKDRTSMAEDKLRKRIQFRQVEAKVEREPDLQALKARAEAAPTDFEQRKLYIDYYTAFCDRMTKFDKTLKKEDVDALRVSYTGRFYQTRIAPTVDPATFRKNSN